MKMPKLYSLKTRVSTKSALSAVFGISALTLCISLFAELFLSKNPCFLCLVERWVYCLLLGPAFIGISFPNWQRFAKRCCQGLLILSFTVSAYHSLVQFQILLDRCQTSRKVEDLSSYKTMLLSHAKKRPSCSEVSWKIGIVPMPIVNAALSILLFFSLIKSREKWV